MVDKTFKLAMTDVPYTVSPAASGGHGVTVTVDEFLLGVVKFTNCSVKAATEVEAVAELKRQMVAAYLEVTIQPLDPNRVK